MGNEFTFAVLDDVVMSVDSQHRRQFCKRLKVKFPDTQFVITTHDQVWARQLRSDGVIAAKSSVAFHTWTVETGPVIDEVAEVWDGFDLLCLVLLAAMAASLTTRGDDGLLL